MEELDLTVYKILFVIFILIVAIFVFITGLSVKTITINPTETEVTAYLSTKSAWLLFNEKKEVIPEIKQAIITKQKFYKSGIFYLHYVGLETYSGQRTLIRVIFGFNESYSALKLQNQINDLIQKRTPFTKTFRQTEQMFIGLFFIILCISVLLYEYIKAKSDEELPESLEIKQEEVEYDEDEQDYNGNDYIEIDEYEEYEKKDNIQIEDKDTDD
ncbi:MAG: hypothetical protein J6T23_03540 [Elusimicrobia bacterium]|nr:hypothetical protein [Elusimicrobiota bacterium]